MAQPYSAVQEGDIVRLRDAKSATSVSILTSVGNIAFEMIVRGHNVLRWPYESVDAFKAHPQNCHYAATKAAVVSLTRSFAHHVARDGILINSVAPAGMATERAHALGFLEELAKASPLGRGAQPSEIAEWVLMTGGPKNTYMTGEQVIVSGGYIYA